MKRSFCAVAVVLLVVGAPKTYAQCQLAKLIAPDRASVDLLGSAVGVSGQTVLVGAPFHDEAGHNFGSAYVFRRSGGVWPLAQELSPGDRGGLVGRAVAIDGPAAVVAATSTWSYTYRFDGQFWIRESRLKPDDHDASVRSFIGWTADLQGSVAVVGAPRDIVNEVRTGSAYVFERDPTGVWFQTAKLLADDGTGGDKFGAALAIRDNLIVVGAPEDDPLGFSSGSAYIFERDLNGTWVQAPKLLPSVHRFVDSFGQAVAVDDQTVFVGAFNAPAGAVTPGAVFIFEPDADGQWVEIQKLTPPGGENSDFFGISVAIDGDLAVVGAENYAGPFFGYGAAFVYHRGSDRTWALVGVLMADEPQDGAEFGRSVAISGNLVAVGAPWEDVLGAGGQLLDRAGAAYVFAVGPDEDGDGVMDVCFCPGDTDGEFFVGLDDLVTMLIHFATPSGATRAEGDTDADGDVDLQDLAILLSNWERTCP